MVFANARRSAVAFSCTLALIGTAALFTGAPSAEAATTKVGDVVRVPAGVSLVYTGEEQVGINELSTYNTKTVTGSKLFSVSGQFKATAVGTYTATVSLVDKSKHMWSDGSVSDKQVVWSIGKAKLPLPSFRYDLKYSGKTLSPLDKAATAEELEFGSSIAKSQASSARIISNSSWVTANAKYATALAGGGSIAETQKAFDKAAESDEKLLAAESSSKAAELVKENYWSLYEITGATAKNSGVYKAKANLKDPESYQWEDSDSATVKMTWYLLEAPQNLKVTAKKITIKAGRTGSPLKVTGAKSTVSYKKVSGSPKLAIDKKTGKVKVASNAAKGTYKAKIKVIAKADKNHLEAEKTVLVRIKVA